MERVSSLIMCYIEFLCACVEPAFFLISNLKYSSWRMILCRSGRTDKCTDHLPFAFASLENAYLLCIMAEKLKITLVKSPIGAIPKQRATVEALGLRKLNKTVELPDNDAVRGMVWHVKHLVKVEEI